MRGIFWDSERVDPNNKSLLFFRHTSRSGTCTGHGERHDREAAGTAHAGIAAWRSSRPGDPVAGAARRSPRAHPPQRRAQLAPGGMAAGQAPVTVAAPISSALVTTSAGLAVKPRSGVRQQHAGPLLMRHNLRQRHRSLMTVPGTTRGPHG